MINKHVDPGRKRASEDIVVVINDDYDDWH